MDPLGHKKLLFIPIFSLIIFNSAHAQCVEPNCISLEPAMAPNMEPVASPGWEPVPSPTPTPMPEDTFAVPFSTILPRQSDPSLFSNQLSVSVPGFSESSSPNPELKKICDSTDYPSLCVSTISPFLNGKVEPASVLEIAIKATTEQTKLAISMMTKMASAPGNSPQTASKFNDCKNSFNDALDNFESAMGALPGRDVGTMNSMLSAAITDYGDCDDEFLGQSSPLSVYNEKLTQMVSNCLAIVSLI